jgi:hypothetical protein
MDEFPSIKPIEFNDSRDALLDAYIYTIDEWDNLEKENFKLFKKEQGNNICSIYYD